MPELIDEFRRKALGVMARGGPVVPLLEAFVQTLQTAMPGITVGLTVLDKPGRTFRHAIFPALPAHFAASLTGNRITGTRGSCGMAVMTGRPVEVPDVASDPRFSDEWKALFREHDLHALVSFPAVSEEGVVQGSLAVIHPPGMPLTVEQRTLLRHATQLCVDLFAYSRSQEAAKILIEELDHRMRNLFTTIGAMAVFTSRHYPQPKEFRRVFEGRLIMMQKSHALAVTHHQTDLLTLLQDTLAPYSCTHRTLLDGPQIDLAPEAASSIALVVHELSTNAAKYGAFSQPGGTLNVEWTLKACEEDGQRFNLVWKEGNGPPVAQPTHKGYGTLMISGSLRNAFDASASLAYDPLGFSCSIHAPFTARLGSVAPATDAPA
ncbi:GAF domain-containing protein [Pseudomonas sp. S75]|uniref:HWE histidine kinase domain-containing protein n=1 Tax=unclassified Pseudomonas TaxID=196821 RepID=UPI0019064F22|nr:MULTISPECIES: HWE histidine kinase domain-containing protein [unclassified Pseudomonas]MBJ9977702.1 GAF domain-containing protein [Pseudomonas sp. S30]MBK0155074.1 GAF domain-containing protein [Pseudomonas sp. S75]